jgi:2'-5' RNA ligase
MIWEGEKPMSYDAENTGRARLRLFFALWPPLTVAQALQAWVERASADCGGRPMRAETLHLTLAFLGDTPVSALPSLIELTRSQRLQSDVLMLNRYGAFMRQGILWAGPDPDAPAVARLGVVHHALWRALHNVLKGMQPTQRFRPHVTLLREAQCRHLPVLPPPISWHYDRYVLVASEPGAGKARYRLLA